MGQIEERREPDVDARFLLANERTLLAWLRTALALEAGGVALIEFGASAIARDILGMALLVLGTATGIVGLRRYRFADAALRRNDLPARGIAPELVMLGTIAVAGALAVAYIISELMR